MPVAVSALADERMHDRRAHITASHPAPPPCRHLRVVHLVTRSHRRGAEVVALELAAALDALGHENRVRAIGRAANGQSIDELPALVPSSRLGLLTYLRSCVNLRRVLKHEPADLVLAHGGWAAIVVAFAAPRSTVKIWQRILGFPMERWGPVRRLGWRTVARRFDGVVALTPEMVGELRHLGYEGPVWLIANARDPERFATIDRADASATLRAEIGVDPAAPLLAFVGHLVDQKQPELAVDVLDEVRRHGLPAHLVIAGDGPRRRTVARRVEELGREDAVTLLGHRADPELIFGAADIAIITSRAEGIPGVAIEAQMAGCPVVSFPVGAVSDVVQDGVTGVILDQPDAGLMGKQVAGVLDDRSQLQRMSRAASAAGAVFTTASTASLYAATFAELIAQVGDRGAGRTS
jgi:glycosyltransferase involved in cell wall biosynthesis